MTEQHKPDTACQEFAQWYVENAFDYVRDPIGSRECGLQWKAWQAATSAAQARIAALEAECDEARARVAELEPSARRYEWLRQHEVDSYLAAGKEAALDAAIDAQLKPQEGA